MERFRSKYSNFSLKAAMKSIRQKPASRVEVLKGATRKLFILTIFDYARIFLTISFKIGYDLTNFDRIL